MLVLLTDPMHLAAAGARSRKKNVFGPGQGLGRSQADRKRDDAEAKAAIRSAVAARKEVRAAPCMLDWCGAATVR